MGRAPKAWVVGSERHFHHVEQALGHFSFLDEACRGLMRGHLDRRIVVGGAHDEIRLGHNAALIGPVVMGKSPARRFDNSDALGWSLRRPGVHVRRDDLWIRRQFHPALGRV
jgi:hypothetical protein